MTFMLFRASLRQMDSVRYQVGNGLFVPACFLGSGPVRVRLFQQKEEIITTWDRIFPITLCPSMQDRICFEDYE